MANHYSPPPGFMHTDPRPEYDPRQNAVQVGHRIISGLLPSVSERISLLSWAIAFRRYSHSRGRYRRIEAILADMDGDAMLPLRLIDVPGDRFGSMSERTDLMGEYSTIWITANRAEANKRGAVMACLNGTIVQLIAIAPYANSAKPHSVDLMESIALHMNERSPESLMAHEVDAADVMFKLPMLEDVGDYLQDATIDVETYEGNQ